MKSQRAFVKRGDWDNLLLLDACRFDYFQRVYEDYLGGELLELWSVGTRTIDWLRGTFDKRNFQDTVYVSSNPHVNSKAPQRRFDGTEYFADIVDVWDWGWDEELKTVPPEKVNEGALEARENAPEQRLLVHYVQPHWPYLELDWSPPEHENNVGSGGLNFLTPNNLVSIFGEEVYVTLGEIFRKIVGWKRAYKMARSIGLTESRDIEDFARAEGKKRLREEYERNLREVLKKAGQLAGELDGRAVITADHGEYLGENGLYGHHYRCNSSILRKVPWLFVEK